MGVDFTLDGLIVADMLVRTKDTQQLQLLHNRSLDSETSQSVQLRDSNGIAVLRTRTQFLNVSNGLVSLSAELRNFLAIDHSGEDFDNGRVLGELAAEHIGILTQIVQFVSSIHVILTSLSKN